MHAIYTQSHDELMDAELPHSNVENDMVVHVQRTAATNSIATHYCNLVRWLMYKNKHDKLMDTSM